MVPRPSTGRPSAVTTGSARCSPGRANWVRRRIARSLDARKRTINRRSMGPARDVVLDAGAVGGPQVHEAQGHAAAVVAHHLGVEPEDLLLVVAGQSDLDVDAGA